MSRVPLCHGGIKHRLELLCHGGVKYIYELCVVIIETYGGFFVSAQEDNRRKRDKTAKVFYSVF